MAKKGKSKGIGKLLDGTIFKVKKNKGKMFNPNMKLYK
jgi:hypothetical protein